MIISYKLSPLGKGFKPTDPHTAVTNDLIIVYVNRFSFVKYTNDLANGSLLDYVSKYINKPDELTVLSVRASTPGVCQRENVTGLSTVLPATLYYYTIYCNLLVSSLILSNISSHRSIETGRGRK